MKKISLAVLLFISLPLTLSGQGDILTEKLNQIKSTYSVVGMSVAVTKGDTLVYTKGFGQRDIARNLPVDDSTVYRIASISKMITATALMILYDQGWINLDADISNYLGFTLRNPSFPNDVITTRMVLSHTASLRDGTGYDSFLSATYNSSQPPHIKSLLQSGGQYYTANMWSTSLRPASKYFSYSNINYGVIGTIIENVSGIRFDIFCRDNIFVPLGIDGSFNVRNIANINNVSVLYRKSGSTWVPQTDNYQGIYPPAPNLTNYTIGTNGVIFAPQGGVRISASGLAKFMMMHLNDGVYNGIRILTDTTARLMHNPQWIYNGSNGFNYYGIFNTYGFGCHRTNDLLSTETLYGHPGEAYGLISDMYFSKIKDYGIIFITNGGVWGSGSYSGWYNIEEAVFTNCLQQLPNLVTGTEKEREPALTKNSLSIYPSPISGRSGRDVTLEISGHGSEEGLTVNLFNILGQLVVKYEVPPGFKTDTKILVNTSVLPAGTYIVSVNLSGNFLTGKLVII